MLQFALMIFRYCHLKVAATLIRNNLGIIIENSFNSTYKIQLNNVTNGVVGLSIIALMLTIKKIIKYK